MTRFPEDFMFQLTREEVDMVKSQNVISLSNYLFEGESGGRRKLPYAFTEQGIYMLATVLKGEFAEQQSIFIMRAFREMRHYLLDDKHYISADDLCKLSMRVNDNMKDIQEIKKEMITKQYFDEVMKEFAGPKVFEEVVFLNGEKFTATLAYEQIYASAKQSVFIIDNYISPKTLIHLKGLSSTVHVILFSDNLGKGLSGIEFSDFKAQYPDVDISLQITNGKYHDRYIIVDYGTEDEAIYHCGASSKDAGNRIASIVKVRDVSIYTDMIRALLKNPALLL